MSTIVRDMDRASHVEVRRPRTGDAASATVGDSASVRGCYRVASHATGNVGWLAAGL